MIKILVIEDDPNVADFVKRQLLHTGFEVTVACTGYEGMGNLRENDGGMPLARLRQG